MVNAVERVPGWEWGRTVVNRVVRDVFIEVFTEVVTLECRLKEVREPAVFTWVRVGEVVGRVPTEGTARVKILCWAWLVGKK